MSSRRTRTQVERVHRALEREGSRGLDPTQFLAPDVYDGGPPILNFAGRVAELRAAGHQIEPRGRRNGCRVLVLVTAPTQRPAPNDPSPSAASVLFNPPPPPARSAILGDDR